ncbi:MAG: LLM class flavin-dependent oxidoreductase [Alphaproteobacteria bacterium]|nr:LLM class flavin-dependent oxidoreductase [Alphaproteobacteria bacterium]
MMKLGFFLYGTGHHIASWREDGIASDANRSLPHYVDITQTAERALFDFVFNADSNSTFGPDDPSIWQRTTVSMRLEPLTLLGALSAVTSYIGLISTATTTYLDPFHVARMFATLDQLSEGRVGWNVVTSSAASEALNFSQAAHAPHDQRYERAVEFLDVVQGLWDTWDDDAHLMDKKAGQFFDPAKLHMLRHKGRHFQVRGPLMVPRSPQGQPVIVQAGQSEAGLELAARTAEVLFTVQLHLDTAKAFYADLKARTIKAGRSPDAIKVMPGVLTVIGRTRQEARDKFERLQELIHPVLGVAMLSDIVGLDLTPYPLDGPMPEVPLTNTQQGRQKVVMDMARREHLTIRQVYMRVAGARGHRMVHGTAADIADALEEWYRAGAADGFNIMPQVLPAGLNEFCEGVVPELQRRGLFRTAYEGKTLRENLGLPRPANRFSGASAAAE